jgi:RNA polymerase sigma-70 factor (ECF subfamily)
MLDEELILAWQDHQDEQAADALCSRWRPRLFTFFCGKLAPKDIAEDLTQETLFRVLRSNSFKKGKPIGPWMWTIAGNVRCDHCRRKRRLGEIPLETEEESAPSPLDDMRSDAQTPEDVLLESEFQTVLYSCIALLEPKQRDVILLRANGLSFQDIADVLRKPLATVYGVFQGACSTLRTLLQAKAYRKPSEEGGLQ